MPSCWKRFLQCSQALLGAAAPLLAAAAAAPLTSKQERKAAKPNEKKIRAIEIQKNRLQTQGIPKKETRRYKTYRDIPHKTPPRRRSRKPSTRVPPKRRVWRLVFDALFSTVFSTVDTTVELTEPTASRGTIGRCERAIMLSKMKMCFDSINIKSL